MCIWLKKATAFCLCLLVLWGSGGVAVAVEPLMPAGQAQEEPEGDLESETVEQPETGIGTEAPEPDAGIEAPGGEASEPDGGMEASGDGSAEGDSYTVTLEDQVIQDGEELSYTTISSEFAGSDIQEGYYPGTLTVVLTGQVVVESGGSLNVGTLSVGGPEANPVITGDGTIVVKAGGRLRLTCADLSPQGEGPVIIQEAGASVELTNTAVGEGMVQWSGPLVDNLHKNPDDLWLEAGTALTADLLPVSMKADVQEQGSKECRELSLSWDMSGYDGQTNGELTMTGQFLDESGQPLSSLVPLTLRVCWYMPGTLVVTEAEWKGDTVPTVELTVQELPEFADVWGEVSTDNGDTWTRWKDEDRFFIVEAEQEVWACIFQLADETPGLFRVAAEDPWADPYAYWRSEAFELGPSEDDEDSGGNRGGSTTPDTPDREPEPEPRPDDPMEGEENQEGQSQGEASKPSPPTEREPEEQMHPETPLTVSGQERPERLVQTWPDKKDTRAQEAEKNDSLLLAEREPGSNLKGNASHEKKVLQEGGGAVVAADEEPALAAVEKVSAAQTAPQVLSEPLQLLMVVVGLAACGAAAVAVGVLRKRK